VLAIVKAPTRLFPYERYTRFKSIDISIPILKCRYILAQKSQKKLLFYQQLPLFVIGMSINKSIVINCFEIKLMNGKALRKPSFNRNVIKTLLTSNMLYLLFTYNGTNDLMCIHLHCKTITPEKENVNVRAWECFFNKELR